MAQIAEVIKYEGDNSTFIWKHPSEDFNCFTQLIVHESQEAIFFMNGQALDLFGPGRYTLETQNIPIIGKLLNRVTGDQSPFHCEVYFINKTEQMGIKWGTDSKVQYIDPTYGFPISIGASGEMSLRAEDSRKLLLKLVGTENFLGQQKLTMLFRSFLMTRVKTYIAQVMKANAINIFEIDENLTLFSESIKALLVPDFADYGVSLEQFFVTNIVKPDGDRQYETFIIPRLTQAVQMFETISGFLDADARADACRCRIEELKMIKQQKEAEEKRIQQEKQKREKKERKITRIAVLIGIVVLGVLIAFNSMFCSGTPSQEESGIIDDQKFNFANGDMNEEQALEPADPWITEFDSFVIGAGDQYTVGLKSDGTVYAIRYNVYGQCDISGWTDIISVSANAVHTVGLKSDGTVVAVGRNSDGRCNVSKWNSIVAVSAGRSSTLGLRSDGTVVAVGSNRYSQCDVSGWTDIIAIETGETHTVGLKSDGTVVTVGANNEQQCDVSGWRDIVAISAGRSHTVGLKSDGTVVAVGRNYDNECDVQVWTGIKLPKNK